MAVFDCQSSLPGGVYLTQNCITVYFSGTKALFHTPVELKQTRMFAFLESNYENFSVMYREFP